MLESTGPKSPHLGYLDGLRGIAALWVFAGHVAHFCQWTIPLISRPGFAVDLFMLLSGFLMYYQAQVRSEKEPMNSMHSWVLFWLRRFFRIAPLFYIALIAAFLFGPYLADGWAAVRAAYGKDDSVLRFTDQSFTNIILHYTFLFGFFPSYETRTALPDWSIALEMQFYLLFPLLFVFMRGVKPWMAIVCFFLLCLSFDYLYADALTAFAQPSFIVMKLHIFLAGMLIGAAYFSESKPMVWAYAVCAWILGILPFSYQIIPRLIDSGIILSLIALALHDKMGLPQFLSRLIDKVAGVLGNKFFRFTGDVSYGVYLIHFFITIPVCYYMLIHYEEVLSPAGRFFASMLISIPITYAIAYVLHRTIEKPGIAWGRKLVQKLKNPEEKQQFSAVNL